MGVVKARQHDIELLARLIRAEAEGEGALGMLMVGNVGVNRIRANCLDFKGIRTMYQMVFQRPGGFEATLRGYFYQRARHREIRLARRCVKGERYWPATFSLWFHKPPPRQGCPRQWFGQRNTGRYKSHCFFAPAPRDCPAVYSTY